MRILIVDDEERYCQYISVALESEGHDVQTAQSGRQAIEDGLRLPPDVLATDWILKNHLHGLHVSQALRAVAPSLRTVLITGFLSPDLRAESERAQVDGLLEKPFVLDDLVSTVDQVAKAATAAPGPLEVAMVAIDAAGALKRINPPAQKLLAEAAFDSPPERFEDFFDREACANPVSSMSQWRLCAVRSATPTEWWIRSRILGDGWVAVLLPEDRGFLRFHPTIAMVLGVPHEVADGWPYPESVLLIDDQDIVREAYSSELESIGCCCYTADSEDFGLRLLQTDPNIGIVVLDYHMPKFDVPRFIQKTRATRPGLKVVGMSTQPRQQEFLGLGVDLFLEKPWFSRELIRLLQPK